MLTFNCQYPGVETLVKRAAIAPLMNCVTQGFCKHFAHEKRTNHAWADIDRDGDLDLLVGGRDTGGGRPNFLFRNDIGSQNRWLAIEVEGDGSEVTRDALGTRVSVNFDEDVVMQEKKWTRHVQLKTPVHSILVLVIEVVTTRLKSMAQWHHRFVHTRSGGGKQLHAFNLSDQLKAQ